MGIPSIITAKGGIRSLPGEGFLYLCRPQAARKSNGPSPNLNSETDGPRRFFLSHQEEDIPYDGNSKTFHDRTAELATLIFPDHSEGLNFKKLVQTPVRALEIPHGPIVDPFSARSKSSLSELVIPGRRAGFLGAPQRGNLGRKRSSKCFHGIRNSKDDESRISVPGQIGKRPLNGLMEGKALPGPIRTPDRIFSARFSPPRAPRRKFFISPLQGENP